MPPETCILQTVVPRGFRRHGCSLSNAQQGAKVLKNRKKAIKPEKQKIVLSAATRAFGQGEKNPQITEG